MASIRAKLVAKMMKKGLDLNKGLYEIRADFEKLSPKLKLAKGVYKEETQVHHMKAEWFIPENAQHDQVIYYIHGGGYCLGVFDATRGHASRLAKSFKRKVLMVDYRLAPENPYPAGVEDTELGLEWLIEKGYDAKNIMIYAESAGCGLALNVFTRLRDKEVVMPSGAVFSTPFVDASMSRASVKEKASVDPYYSHEKYAIINYYVAGADPKDPKLSPLYDDLKGLPPILIHGAENDMFRDDSTALYRVLRSSGVEVEHKIWQGVWHVFHMNADLIPEGKKALKECSIFINQKL